MSDNTSIVTFAVSALGCISGVIATVVAVKSNNNNENRELRERFDNVENKLDESEDKLELDIKNTVKEAISKENELINEKIGRCDDAVKNLANEHSRYAHRLIKVEGGLDKQGKNIVEIQTNMDNLSLCLKDMRDHNENSTNRLFDKLDKMNETIGTLGVNLNKSVEELSKELRKEFIVDKDLKYAISEALRKHEEKQ